MTNDENSIRVSEFCYYTYQTLQNTIQGIHVDDLSQSVGAFEDLER